jgi:hypothetical protein
MAWEDLLGDALSEASFRKLFTYPGALVMWGFKGFKGSFRDVVKQQNEVVLFLLGVLFYAAILLSMFAMLG